MRNRIVKETIFPFYRGIEFEGKDRKPDHFLWTLLTSMYTNNNLSSNNRVSVLVHRFDLTRLNLPLTRIRMP